MSTETILTESTIENVDEAIAEALGEAYDCLRVWSAWSYGTMGPDDFSLVAEDSDRLAEIRDAAIQAILQSPQVQQWKKDAGRYQWLRDAPLSSERVVEDMHECCLGGDDLDAAIDAAMEKKA